MNTKHVFLCFVLAAALTAGAAAGRPSEDFKLVEDLTIGGPDKDELFLWTAVSVDADGNIYFADALDCSVKKFDPAGRFLKKAGRKGRGPGEFEKAVGVAVAGETVYAWDVYGRTVQVFDRELVFQRTLTMPGTVGAFDVFPDGRLAVAVRASIGLPAIFILSPDGTKSRVISLADPKDPSRIDTVGLVADPAGGFTLGYLFSDRIERRTENGDLIWTKTPIGGRPVEPENVQGLRVPSQTCVLSLARDVRGRIYVLGGNKAVHPGRDVFIFSPDGIIVGAFCLPEPSHSVYFDRQDRLYVSADGGVTMKRYRLVPRSAERASVR